MIHVLTLSRRSVLSGEVWSSIILLLSSISSPAVCFSAMVTRQQLPSHDSLVSSSLCLFSMILVSPLSTPSTLHYQLRLSQDDLTNHRMVRTRVSPQKTAGVCLSVFLLYFLLSISPLHISSHNTRHWSWALRAVDWCWQVSLHHTTLITSHTLNSVYTTTNQCWLQAGYFSILKTKILFQFCLVSAHMSRVASRVQSWSCSCAWHCARWATQHCCVLLSCLLTTVQWSECGTWCRH